MNSVVREFQSDFTKKYVHYKDSNGSVGREIEGLEYDLLKVFINR